MLDLHSLTLAGFVSQVTFTLTLSTLAWSDRRSLGTRWLAAACGLQLLGTVVRQIFGQPASRLMRDVGGGLGHSLLVVVFFLMYMGLRWFTDRRPLQNRAGPLAVIVSVAAILCISLRSAEAGLALSRMSALVIMSFALRTLLRVRFPELRRSSRLTAVLLASFMAVLLFRLALDLGFFQGDLAQAQAIARCATVTVFTLLAFCSVTLFAAESKRRLRVESREDSLTRLGNRRAIEEEAAEEIRLAERHGKPLTLLMLDLDHFKQLNDTYGHEVGDRALQAVGSALKELLSGRDFAARLGGEEFAVLLPGRELESAAFLGERFRRAVESLRLTVGNDIFGVTVSVGVSEWAGEESGWEPMLRRADKALYQAKREGRNGVVLWSAAREALQPTHVADGCKDICRRAAS